MALGLKEQQGAFSVYREALQGHGGQLSTLTAQLTSQKDGLAKELGNLKSSVQLESTRIDKSLDDVKGKVASQTGVIEKVASSWTQVLDQKDKDWKEKQQNAMSNWENEKEATLRAIDSERAQKISALAAENKTRLVSIEEEYRERLKTLSDENGSKMKAIEEAYQKQVDSLEKKASDVAGLAEKANATIELATTAKRLYSGGVPIVAISAVELVRSGNDLVAQPLQVINDPASSIQIACNNCVGVGAPLRITRNDDRRPPELPDVVVSLTFWGRSALGDLPKGSVAPALFKIRGDDKVQLGSTPFYVGVPRSGVADWEQDSAFDVGKWWQVKRLRMILYISAEALEHGVAGPGKSAAHEPSVEDVVSLGN